MPYKIERDIDPLPLKVGRARIYDFQAMQIGDSFKVPDFAAPSARVQAAKHQRAHGTKYISRKVPGGIRIWRVK